MASQSISASEVPARSVIGNSVVDVRDGMQRPSFEMCAQRGPMEQVLSGQQSRKWAQPMHQHGGSLDPSVKLSIIRASHMPVRGSADRAGLTFSL